MNEIKVYQCEKCGEIMDETAYRTSGNGIHFNLPTESVTEPCGGSMRAIILADPAEVRRETIGKFIDLLEKEAGRFRGMAAELSGHPELGYDPKGCTACELAVSGLIPRVRALADAPREVDSCSRGG